MTKIDFNGWQTDFSKLHQEMKDAMALRNMADYAVLCNPDGSKMENASQVILNYPRVFGDAIVSMLNKDNEEIKVERCDATVQRWIEDWWTDAKYNNNLRLTEHGKKDIDTQMNFDICYRGCMMVLPLISYDPVTGKYLITIEAYDPLAGLWKKGPRGIEATLNWMRLGKEETEKKYSDYMQKQGKKQPSLTSDEDKPLLAVQWDTKYYSLYEARNGTIPQNAEPWFSVEHRLGFCPMKVVGCTLGTDRTSGGSYADDLVQENPHIYAPVMKTIKYMNEFVSVMATVNRQQFETPLQVEGGDGMDLEGVTFHGWGTVIPTPEGVKIVPIAQPQVSAVGQNLFVEMFKSFEIATLSTVNYGMAGDRQSALAIINLKSDNEKQLGPRRDAKEIMNRQILNSFARQISTGKYYKTDIPKDDEFAIDEIDKKGAFIENGKKRKFYVHFDYDLISKQENIANMQLFIEGKQNNLDEEDLARDILGKKDPPGYVRKSRLQELRNLVPAMKIADGIVALDPDNKVMEKEVNLMMRDILWGTLKEIKDSENHPLRQPVNNNTGSPSNLMNSTAQANSNKLAANEQKANGQQAVRNATQARES